jgi:hypothetical protein
MKILKWFLNFILGAAFGAIISLSVTKGLGGGQIQPSQAQQFLRSYYGVAVKPTTVEQAWQMLTPEFQKESGGQKAFVNFYASLHKAEVGELQSAGGINQFMGKLTFIDTHNLPSSGQAVWDLSCADIFESYNPFNSSCSVENIQMDYYGYQTNP